MTSTSTSARFAHVSTPSKSPPYPNAKHPEEVSPDDCPDVYASTARGTCLEPVFSDGVCLVMSRIAPVAPGDYVTFWLRPDIPQAAELPRRVKRLRSIAPGITFPYRPAAGSEIMPLVEFEQHNPPRVLRVPADHILAIHKVIGTAIRGEDGFAQVKRSVLEGKASHVED